MSLKKQAKAGLFWTFLEQFGTQIIGLVISILLARLLTPQDFGVIALFTVVMSIAAVLVEGGLTSSIIRTKDPNEDDFSTVFHFNLVMSIILYVVILFCAPFIADYYQKPILTTVIRVYALTIILNAFSTVQRTQLTKAMQFKTLFKINLPSQIISGVVGIVLAYFGFGVWSLVYAALIQSFIASLQLWLYSDWKPKIIFNKQKFKFHFTYGYRITLSGLLNIIFNNIYVLIIGKQFSLQQLGYYNRADNLRQLPINNISNALNKVTFPLFAKISDDDIKLKEVYQMLMKLVMFIIAPALTLLVVLAEPLVVFLLSEKWLPTVPYLQILAVAGLLIPIHSYNLNILQVKGRSDLFLKLEIIKKINIVIIVAISLQFGIFGLLWGQVVSSFIAFFINTYYTGQFLKYNAYKQLLDILPSICLAILCGLGIYFAKLMFFQNVPNSIIIIVLGTIYSLMYVFIAFIFKFKEIAHIKQFLKK